jgi:molybdopterin-guanine dinucleotide biosynthesis protein A
MMDAVKKRMTCGGRPMTAIVLAGGRGRRMNADKGGLAVGRKTLLAHVLEQVAPYFDEVLVGISPGQKLAPLSCESPSASPRVVEDEIPGSGPLGGLLSGLKAATNEACAVVACDIPDIDVPLLRSLARAAADAEIAVPAGPSGLHEPLFAIYRKSIVPEIEALLAGGERSILPLYETCRTAVVRFEDAGRVRNLNTREDYEAYLRSIADRPAGKSGGRSGGQRKRPSMETS